jgi:phage terminase small subunit
MLDLLQEPGLMSVPSADPRDVEEAVAGATEKSGVMAKGLTKKQEVFVAEYLTDFNGTRSAIAAGYSEKGAEVTASQLLRNPKVKEQIERKSQKRLDKLDITAEKVLQEIAKLAFFDPRKLFNNDGSAKQIGELDDVTAAALAGVEIFEEFEGRGEERTMTGYTKKFKLADKGQNLERLGKHLKLFTDKIEHTGKNGEALVPSLEISFVTPHGKG